MRKRVTQGMERHHTPHRQWFARFTRTSIVVWCMRRILCSLHPERFDILDDVGDTEEGRSAEDRCNALWPLITRSPKTITQQVDILMPTKKPCGQELTREQHMANRVLNQRRLRIAHVHRSVKRCRIVKDRIRLWKAGVCDLVMELCCALHNFRVRLTP